MSLLIQINSVDQITFFSQTSLSSAVRETNSRIPQQLVALQYFLLIRCVLSHYNRFHSTLVLQQLSIFLCMLQSIVLGALPGCLVSPRPLAARPVHQWQLLGETTTEPGPFGWTLIAPGMGELRDRKCSQTGQCWGKHFLAREAFGKKKHNDKNHFSLKHLQT